MPSARLSVILESVLGSAWNADFQRAVSDIQRFEEKAQKAGAVLSAAFTLPLALVGRTAVKNGAELDGMNRSMIAITGSAAEAAKQTKKLNEVAKLPGLNFKDSLSGFVQLKAAGFSTELATKSLQNFGNALGVLGKTGALGSVNAQLQQMATRTGSVGEDMRILKSWVPQVSVALQDAFGTTNTELIAKMGYTGKDVVEKLVNELGKLPKATGGIGNALENMGDAWFKFTGRIGLAIDKAIDLSGIFNTLSEAMNDLATWFENLDPFWQKTILGITGITAVIGPLLLGLAAISPLFGAIGTASSLLFSGPVAVAFATVVAAFVAAKVASDIFTNGWESFWDRLKNKAESTAIEIGLIMRKMELSILSAINVNGSSDAAISRKENELLNIEHNKNSHVSLGNNEFNRKAEPKKPVIKPPVNTGSATEKGPNYWAELQEEEAYKRMIANKIEFLNKDKDFQNKLKNQSAGTWSVVGTAIKALPTDTKASLDKFFTNVDTGLKKVSETIKNTPISRPLSEQVMAINELISQGSDNVLVGMAEWAGAFSVGVKSFKDLGNLLKSIFGDIMISIGKQMVVTSEAWIAFKKAMLASGTGGLAIGLGLIVAGSALKASASKGASGGYQSVPQNSVSNYQPIYTPYNAQATGGQNARISIEINQGNTITRGQDLVTSYRNTTYDQSRG